MLYPPVTRRQGSWATTALMDALRRTPPGEIVPYKALSEAAGGLDVQRTRRYVLNRACALLREDEGLSFDTVTNIGLRRLTSLGIVRQIESYRHGLERRSRHALAVARCADPDELDGSTQHQLLAYAALFVAIGVMATTKTLEHVQQHGAVPAVIVPDPAAIRGLFGGAARPLSVPVG